MNLRRIALIAILVTLAPAVYAENTPPRDIWGQAASAAMNGDLNTAVQKTNELINTGSKFYFITNYPTYAATAANMAREADKLGKPDVATWAAKVAQQLDPHSPAVAFSLADRARDARNWPDAMRWSLAGYGRMLATYRTRVLGQADFILVLSLAIALAAAIFAVALFIRYGRSMAHDFREVLSQRFRGGAVTVLAFALLFLPLFLWLGPVWLVLYWFVIFFGYANVVERVFIALFCVLLATLPILVDWSATQTAGIDNPIVQATILSSDQSYRPEALHRVEEFAAIVSDNDTVHLLLGNLQLQEGNEQAAQIQYRRAAELRDSAGVHVNLGNLHFSDNDFAAAVTEYERAEQLDPKLAIAWYNNSLASGEMYHFDDQGKELEQAKKLGRVAIERLTQNPPPTKVVLYTPSLERAWDIATSLARKGAAQTLFATFSYFDPAASAVNPISIGSIAALLIAVAVWRKRRKAGFANACIKCGRTFCYRCKSARESATYCTQCIHIYLKRDGVSLDTKRAKLEEVHDHQTGTLRRNKLLATFLPGSAQVIEGRTISGALGAFVFLLMVCFAILIGRLAPAVGPVAETAQLMGRVVTALLAAIVWCILVIPVYRRRQLAS